jgi:hypothetical protein
LLQYASQIEPLAVMNGEASGEGMKGLSTLLALAASGAGGWAALKWYNASKVEIDLGYTYPGMPPGETYSRMGVGFPRIPESGDPAMQQMNETAATWDAMKKAARLNKVAAGWTALSAALWVFSVIFGAVG